jgi:hypothetical protein
MGKTGTGRTPIGAILAIVGGVLIAVGSFFAWASVTAEGTTVIPKGIDGADGYITLCAGIVALTVGVLMLRQAGRTLAILAILAIMAGLIGGSVAVYDAITAEDSVRAELAEEVASSIGVSPEQARDVLDQLVDSGQVQLDVSIGIGIYVVIAGGVLSLASGIVSMRGSAPSSAPTEPVTIGEAAPPAPLLTPPEAAPSAPEPSAPTADEGGS